MSEFSAPISISQENYSQNVNESSSGPTTPSMADSRPKPNGNAKPCVFFAQGTCRHGNECRFSHSTEVVSSGVAPPAPIIISIPPGQPVFSIDVECVATGVQHHARSIAQVALVDEWSRPIFNVFIKQDQPVVSYIHELTGLSAELLDKFGLPLGMLKSLFQLPALHF